MCSIEMTPEEFKLKMFPALLVRRDGSVDAQSGEEKQPMGNRTKVNPRDFRIKEIRSAEI